jgi:imidazolonepropionase-like amidohydrolase
MKNDLMLLNGRICTMDAKHPRVEAVAIRDHKIIAVGKNSEVENLGRKNFQVINLEGKTVIPGLIDGLSVESGKLGGDKLAGKAFVSHRRFLQRFKDGYLGSWRRLG